MRACRDCSKCTESGLAKTLKRAGNTLLMVSTLGLSILISKLYHSGRKVCPDCGHPLAWHARDPIGHFLD
jgi:hypothetical protein